MNLSLRFVLRYLRSPEKGSFSSYTSKLSIIGLSIGVSALMLTASIIRGFENTLSDKLSGFDGMVRVQHMLGHSITSNISVLDSMLGQFPLSIEYKPYIRKGAMIRVGNKAAPHRVTNDLQQYEQIAGPIHHRGTGQTVNQGIARTFFNQTAAQSTALTRMVLQVVGLIKNDGLPGKESQRFLVALQKVVIDDHPPLPFGTGHFAWANNAYVGVRADEPDLTPPIALY